MRVNISMEKKKISKLNGKQYYHINSPLMKYAVFTLISSEPID